MEISLKEKNYNIYIDKNTIRHLVDYLSFHFKGKQVMIITDDNVNKLYGKTMMEAFNRTSLANVSVSMFTMKPGEENKSIETLVEIYKACSESKLTRSDLIITFGGGVVGDIGGFAASTYLRGVPFIQVPTTLMAQVDSSIGGKVAIDLPWGKNLVGSFYHPEAVFINSDYLKSLNSRFLHDGIAEVIKYGCIKDEEIIQRLEAIEDDDHLLKEIEEIIFKCCLIKKQLVEKDEKDYGDRKLLNFGHTLGHAIEKYYEYRKYSHGEGVAIGMLKMIKNCEEDGITKSGTYARIQALMKKFSLPMLNEVIEQEKLLNIISLDKKSLGDNIDLIMIREIGHGFIHRTKIDEVKKFII